MNLNAVRVPKVSWIMAFGGDGDSSTALGSLKGIDSADVAEGEGGEGIDGGMTELTFGLEGEDTCSTVM
jgi:hypothetical protein